MKYSFVFLWVFALFSCGGKKSSETNDHSSRIDLLEADRSFSEMSAQKGMKNAFLEYIDSNGVLLKPNTLPIAGASAIDYLIQQNDTGYTLTWQPHDGLVAQSGELGYTYGIYSLKASTEDTVLYGTYVSIWKKQKDGKWKFVLDSGNEGIGEINK